MSVKDPKTFVLYRIEDCSGISGTGVVAQGVEFGDGTVAMRWISEHCSTAIYDNIETLVTIHGHDGKTEVRYL
jgi:hypothetical protein